MTSITDRSTGHTTPLPRHSSSYDAMSEEEIKGREDMMNTKDRCNSDMSRISRYANSCDDYSDNKLLEDFISEFEGDQ